MFYLLHFALIGFEDAIDFKPEESLYSLTEFLISDYVRKRPSQ